MATTAKEKKVADMTVDELKNVIRETMLEMIDPDHGLELSPEFEEKLKTSLKSKERIPADKVTKELGLKW